MEKVVAKLVAAGITPSELQELIYPEFNDILERLIQKGYGFDVLVPIILITKNMTEVENEFEANLLENVFISTKQ